MEPDRPHMTIWRMNIECWITKDTDTHSEYVILVAFHSNNGCTNALQCYVRLILTLFSYLVANQAITQYTNTGDLSTVILLPQ
jgi:hypothetical protein